MNPEIWVVFLVNPFARLDSSPNCFESEEEEGNGAPEDTLSFVVPETRNNKHTPTHMHTTKYASFLRLFMFSYWCSSYIAPFLTFSLQFPTIQRRIWGFAAQSAHRQLERSAPKSKLVFSADERRRSGTVRGSMERGSWCIWVPENRGPSERKVNLFCRRETR